MREVLFGVRLIEGNFSMDSKIVKKFIQRFDRHVRVRSINGQHNKQPITWYIEAWGNLHDCRNLRILALSIIYGEKFEINAQAVAGNIQENHLSMSPLQWAKVINSWETLTAR